MYSTTLLPVSLVTNWQCNYDLIIMTSVNYRCYVGEGGGGPRFIPLWLQDPETLQGDHYFWCINYLIHEICRYYGCTCCNENFCGGHLHGEAIRTYSVRLYTKNLWSINNGGWGLMEMSAWLFPTQWHHMVSSWSWSLHGKLYGEFNILGDILWCLLRLAVSYGC